MSPDEAFGLVVRIAIAIVGSVGGAGVIILGLSAWLGKVWSDRIYVQSRAKYEKEIEDLRARYSTDLEHLRAEISERRDLLNSLQNALSSGYALSHERILESIQVLWNNIVEIREFTSSFHYVYYILLPREFENTPVSKFERILPEMTDENFYEHIRSLQKDIKNYRPLVGEKIWGLYSIYLAFALRLAWKIVKEREQGTVYNWDKNVDGTADDYLLEILQHTFTAAELESIIGEDPTGGVPQRLMDYLEIQIINEMNELIFGKRLVSMSIEEQQRITSLMSSIGDAKEKPIN